MTTSTEVAIIGSGINALTAGAMLAKSGKRVAVFEREAIAGGCMRSETLAEGVTYDPLATTFVLWVTGAAHGALGADLARHGVEFCSTNTPTGVLMPDGRALTYTTDRTTNVAAFNAVHDGDGTQFAADLDAFGADAELLFGLMGGDPWSKSTAKLMAKETWKRKPRGLASTMGGALQSMRNWLETSFDSDLNRALWAPWCLHAGLGPESTFSGQMGQVIGFALEAASAPVIKGGAAEMVRGLIAIIEEHDGSVRTSAEVAKITLTQNKATGLVLTSGEEVSASTVLASTTPNQLYGTLAPTPAKADDLRKYQYGKGNFQLHYLIDGDVKWNTNGLEDVQLLHLSAGLDAVSKAGNEAERGMLPEVPTICVGQPCAADPTRAPAGKTVLWLQMPEAPRVVKGDAKGEIEVPADGQWTDELREAYADRIEAILAQHIDGFKDSVLTRRAISPADLQGYNMNLVGGDPYGGACSVEQFFLWRPFKDSVRHDTGIKGLYHIGASTHPGPGLSGGSGFLTAKELGA
ncbi:phytoene desaturase family protein [Pacificibacter marinus]|uniref:Pyridine nucleotide-disulfide oxidoreductase domain-containing protein 2 n=1 Tax=Pacificibacter marinus TaxID=658057 RepID=A0A1Y5TA50_9RHOB|nr:NAD(P)/FAD-dependent oxidoreductase [Pacificibacter marinus]SEL09574.1 Phytoene dehydrogenase-related protein [Pacificibacter marinus]SLN59104.1 Dehydrosqualene desaturase [Pacificibacter marinus]